MSAKVKRNITKTAMKRKKPSDEIVPPTVAVTHSTVLNMVLSERRTDKLSNPNIAENMLKAVQTATLSAPIGTKRKTVKSAPKESRLRPTTTTQTRSYAPTKSAKAVPITKIPRVIGKEIDIRNQLLTKFTEVAAAKNQTNGHSVKKRRSCPSKSPLQTKVNNETTSIQSSSSSQDSATIDSKSPLGSRRKASKTVSPKPRFRVSATKQCKQNIAFADPDRKVAGLVESMFSSAITKVLNTSPTAISKNGKLANLSLNLSTKKAQKVSSGKDEKRSRTLRNKRPSKQADSSDDDEESQEKLYWENEDDSDNYEETEGHFDDNDVKIEIVSDQQGAEYDYDDQSDLANLHGHQVVDMIVEDVEENEEDPLTVRQFDSANDSVGIVKVENSGTVNDHCDDSDDTRGFFGGESSNAFENEEPEQVTVDVKPHLLPEIETETEGVEVGTLETIIKAEKTENEDDEYNDE